MTRYVTESEIKKDIEMMIIMLQTVIPKDTQGEDKVNEWKEKYKDLAIE